jgi:hypothetical protein
LTSNPFRALWDRGYRRLLPVIPYTEQTRHVRMAGKRPGTLTPEGWWQGAGAKTFEATEADLDAWHAMGASVGLRCDRDVLGIDVDVMDAEWSKRVVALAIEELGPGAIRIGQAPKTMLIYQTYDVMRYRNARFADGTEKGGLVELQAGEGKWFVMHGIHRNTGRKYTWPNDVPQKAALPFVTAAQVDGFFARLDAELPAYKGRLGSQAIDRSQVNQDGLRAPPDRAEALADIIRRLPNRYATIGGYEAWVRMAAAMRGAFQDDPDLGCDAFVEFSENSDIADPVEDPERIYKSLNEPFAFGYPYLVSIISALTAGEVSKTVSSAPLFFEEVAEQAPSESDTELNLFPSETTANRFTFLPFNDAADMALGEKSTPLIKGLLDQGAMSVMYGDSNTGKTFVAMDMGFHIGAGIPYAGMKVTKQLVVYIAAEGGRGAKKRLRALREKFGARASNVAFFLLATSVNLRDPAADLNPLIEALRALCERVGASVGFLVVDTMSRALAGGDENSSVDVGLLVKNFDALRAATGAHLMVVHHSGKDRARGARGWSGLRAATDTELEVAENTIAVGKQRDLDKSWSSGFELEVRTLGVDEDGDPITSCTIRLVDAVAVKVGIATANEQDVLDAIAMLRATDPSALPGVTTRMLEAHFSQNGAPMTAENLRYYIRQLEAKRLVDKPGRGRWAIPPLSSKDNLSERHFEEAEESGGNLEVGVFD